MNWLPVCPNRNSELLFNMFKPAWRQAGLLRLRNPGPSPFLNSCTKYNNPRSKSTILMNCCMKCSISPPPSRLSKQFLYFIQQSFLNPRNVWTQVVKTATFHLFRMGLRKLLCRCAGELRIQRAGVLGKKRTSLRQLGSKGCSSSELTNRI